MRLTWSRAFVLIIVVFFLSVSAVRANQAGPGRILLHMKTSLAEDDAQICAVPNVAWAALKAGYTVTILVDASAVTSVTKGFGWFNRLFRSGRTVLDRAHLPERERRSLSEQMASPWNRYRMITVSTSSFSRKWASRSMATAR
jgi:hypothetical protein